MNNLENELQQFTGTEQWYYNPLYPNMKYTDGVKYFAEKAGAYWFLDITGTEYHPKTTGDNPEWDYFLSIVMTVENEQAIIKVTDGNDKVFVLHGIEYTDCPTGTWKFYLTDNVLLLPSEY